MIEFKICVENRNWTNKRIVSEPYWVVFYFKKNSSKYEYK